jgi:FG-GAP-like repeat
MNTYFPAEILIYFFLLNSCGQINNTPSVNGKDSPDIKMVKTGPSPGSVESADFNNDGFADLAVTSETDSSVTIFLGNGKGGFSQSKASSFPAGSIPNDISVFDFNKDGNIDLAFANHERKYLTVLLGNGKGDFLPAPKSPFSVHGIPHTHGIATGDFNKDGRPDLVTDSWGNDQVEVLFGDSLNLFEGPTHFFKVGRHPYQRLRAADVNGDGITDIVTTNSESNDVTVLLSDGKGGFTEAPGSPFACGDAPFGLAIGDVNADGNPDLAVLNSPASMAEGKGKNGLTIMLGNGKGGFTRSHDSPFDAGRIPNRVAIGDLNGDNINDIVSSDNSSDKIFVFLMNNKGNVSSAFALTVGNHPKGIAIAYLNADSKADIVVCNQADNEISIILSK